MAVSIMRVARTLGRISGWKLSNLEMQKIGFIAEMLYLGRKDESLINEEWQAWAYGPVQPELYHKAKIFGTDPVRDIFYDAPLTEGGAREKSVIDAYGMMKDISPGRMINLTHQPNGAWAGSYTAGMKGKIIPKSAIKREYQTLICDDG